MVGARVGSMLVAVKEGRAAPDFTLTSDSGESVSLSQFRGSAVVLYFYPKDDTRACN
jgi:peroxiredoxin Q/BCP